jgi:hypothetical protein
MFCHIDIRGTCNGGKCEQNNGSTRSISFFIPGNELDNGSSYCRHNNNENHLLGIIFYYYVI